MVKERQTWHNNEQHTVYNIFSTIKSPNRHELVSLQLDFQLWSNPPAISYTLTEIANTKPHQTLYQSTSCE